MIPATPPLDPTEPQTQNEKRKRSCSPQSILELQAAHALTGVKGAEVRRWAQIGLLLLGALALEVGLGNVAAEEATPLARLLLFDARRCDLRLEAAVANGRAEGREPWHAHLAALLRVVGDAARLVAVNGSVGTALLARTS